MRKGLVVMMTLSLALVAFSCTPGGIIVLDAGDHADIVEGVIGNSGEIITILATPTVEQLLSAARQVPAISSSTNTSIKYVLDLLPELEGWLADIPGETLQAIDEIIYNVTQLETVPAATDFLQDAIDSHQYDDYEWLPEALEFGIDLLEAGENTIYSPGWAPYAEEPLVGFNVSQLWRKDLEGGIAGAVGCALAGDAPEQYAVRIGGVVGGVDSSMANLISQLTEWW
jgi:hypothetical protein